MTNRQRAVIIVIVDTECKNILSNICASGSVGGARPCQGRGRGFESRLALLERSTGFGIPFFVCIYTDHKARQNKAEVVQYCYHSLEGGREEWKKLISWNLQERNREVCM